MIEEVKWNGFKCSLICCWHQIHTWYWFSSPGGTCPLQYFLPKRLMDLFNPPFVPAKGSCARVTHSKAWKTLNIVDYVIYYQLQESRQVPSSVKALQSSLILYNLFKGPLKSNTVKTRQQSKGFAKWAHLQRARIAITYLIIWYFTSVFTVLLSLFWSCVHVTDTRCRKKIVLHVSRSKKWPTLKGHLSASGDFGGDLI